MDNLHKFLDIGVLVNDKSEKLHMDLREIFARPDMLKAINELQKKELEKEDE